MPPRIIRTQRLCARYYSTSRTRSQYHRNWIVWGTGFAIGGIFYASPWHNLIQNEPKQLPLDHQRQLNRTWTDVGAWAWGTNKYGITTPSEDSLVTRTPARIPAFDETAFRHVVLAEKHAAAVDLNGNVWQWGDPDRRYPSNADISGLAASPFKLPKQNLDDIQPKLTLQNKDIIKLAATEDKLFALGRNGKVYVLDSKTLERKPVGSSWWWPFGDDAKTIRLDNAVGGERITSIQSGSHHLLALTKGGRVLVASADGMGNSNRQLGDAADSDALKPVPLLAGVKCAEIAAGDLHSLARTQDGRVYAWGANNNGQCGVTNDYKDRPFPTELRFDPFYPRKDAVSCARIAAGGNNSFFVVDKRDGTTGAETVDVLSVGAGQQGALGNNTWSHIQATPVKVRFISGLVEFSEKLNKVIPIKIHDIAVGQTHVAAILDNHSAIHTDTDDLPEGAIFGRDILTWGGNQDFQLGSGKRNNVCMPRHIPPFEIQEALPTTADDTLASSPGVMDMTLRPSTRLQLAPASKRRVKSSVDGGYQKLQVQQAIALGNGTSMVYYTPVKP